MKSSTCPNCGAAVRFRFNGAVQTVCEFCHSILVRTGVDLKRVGEVASVPDNSSPIQIGTEGVWRNKSFEAVGRIVYEYEQGGWSEWHLAFHDSTSGWLSDAQAEYAVSLLASPEKPLARADEITRGWTLVHGRVTYRVATLTHAHYAGVEGELPFEYWDKSATVFADLRSEGGEFATIDYSADPPLLFVGEIVDFDSLQLKNLREFEGWGSR